MGFQLAQNRTKIREEVGMKLLTVVFLENISKIEGSEEARQSRLFQNRSSGHSDS